MHVKNQTAGQFAESIDESRQRVEYWLKPESSTVVWVRATQRRDIWTMTKVFKKEEVIWEKL